MKKILRAIIVRLQESASNIHKIRFFRYAFWGTWSEGLVASHGIASYGNQDTASELNLLCLLFLDAVPDLLQIF